MLTLTLAAAAPAPPTCVIAPADRAWLDQALKAFNLVLQKRLKLALQEPPTILGVRSPLPVPGERGKACALAGRAARKAALLR